MSMRCLAVLFALSALCAAQVTHVQIDVGAPAQPGSITKGEELYITVNNSLPSAWFFFSITTTDTCGVDVANVTFPDGTVQELYWNKGVSFDDHDLGVYIVYLHGVFSTCNIQIAAPDSPIIPLNWSTPTNVTLSTALPIILLVNNTGLIPGVNDPFMLYYYSGSLFKSAVVTKAIDELGSSFSSVDLENGQASYLGAGTGERGFWVGATYLFVSPNSGPVAPFTATLTAIDRPILTLVRNGAPQTVYASGGMWIQTFVQPPLTDYVNLTMTLLDGDCSNGNYAAIMVSSTALDALTVTTNFGSDVLSPNTPTQTLTLPPLAAQLNRTCLLYFSFNPSSGLPGACNFTVQLGVDVTAATLSAAVTTSSASTSSTAATTTSATSTVTAAESTTAEATTASTSTTALTTSLSATSTARATATTAQATVAETTLLSSSLLATSTSTSAATTTVAASTSASPAPTPTHTPAATTATHAPHRSVFGRLSVGAFAGVLVGAAALGALVGGSIVYLACARKSAYEPLP